MTKPATEAAVRAIVEDFADLTLRLIDMGTADHTSRDLAFCLGVVYGAATKGRAGDLCPLLAEWCRDNPEVLAPKEPPR